MPVSYPARRLAVAVAAVVLQLHLFLVTVLHNHQGLSPGAVRHEIRAALSASPGSDAPCPACQIARQGSVNVPSQGLAVADSPKTQSTASVSPVRYSSFPIARPSGRAPPVVS